MKPLILTSLSGSSLMRTDLGDQVIVVSFRFVWDRLPSADELATYVAARSEKNGSDEHWSDFTGRWRQANEGRKDLGLIEFCEPYEAIELWFDPDPNDQLQLIWLLDYFRAHPETAAKLVIRLVDFDLLSKNLSALPLLKPALVDLIAELPSGVTGLGATEMRLLEMLARGFENTNALFHLRTLRSTHIFREFEIGYLLDGLAHGPRPAVAGLDDELRTLARENFRDRHTAYLRSRLSLTEFGEAIVAHEEDFSHHNPIDRWWGGTHLTNDHLWRWGSLLMKPQSSGGR
jgi:hypothetical protein